MKKYLLLLLLLISGVVSAQYPITGSKVRYYNGIGLSTRDTTGWGVADTSVVIMGADSVPYYRYKGYWRQLGGYGKVAYTDTAAMLSPYLRSFLGVKYTDTVTMLSGYQRALTAMKYNDTAAMLSPYLRSFLGVKYSDTAAMLAGYYTMASVNGLLNLKLNISDSAAMLSNYYNKTAVDSRLALKVNYTDTSTMLSPYQRSFNAVKYSDTAAILGTNYYNKVTVDGKLGLKVNYTDTSTMLSPYLRSFLGVKYTDTAAMLSHYLRSSGASYVPYTGATSNLNLGGYNYYGNNYFSGFTTVTASGTLITLTTSSSPVYLVNGSGGQTIQLPNATTLPNGANYYFNNNQSSGAISVNNNSTTLVKSVPSGGYLTLTLIDNSTAAGTWDSHFQAPSNVSWSTNTFDYTGSITSATWNGNVIAINRGGTGSSTQNFVDLTTNQSVAGVKTWNPSVTAASAIARGAYFTPALTAAANNDVLVGLDINPTFTNGAFTSVSDIALRLQNTSGTGKWNLYSSGTAINYLNGALLIGSTTDNGTDKLQVTGSSKFTGNATVTGNLYFGSASSYLFGDANNIRLYDKNSTIILQSFPAGISNSETYLQNSSGQKYLRLNDNAISLEWYNGNTSNNTQNPIQIVRGYFGNIVATDKTVLTVKSNSFSNLTNATTLRGIYIDINDVTTYTGFTTARAIEAPRGGAYFNTTSPNASAILQADATTQGFLPPRMTTVQKLAIASPAEGLQVYDLTLHQMSYYNGTTWINF